jgi:O-antigen ligase
LLKLIFYVLLTLFGSAAALFSPIAGAVAAIGAYLLNPSALAMETGGLRFQQYVTIAFLIGVVAHRGEGLPRKGREAWVVILLWVFVAVGAASSLWAVISTKQALDAVFELVKTLVVATLLLWAIRTERHLRILMIACIIGVLHASTLHVLGSRLGFTASQFSREYGVLPDSQTAVMVLFVPLLLCVTGTGRAWERILAFCTLPMAIDSIVNTFQRTGFVALAVEAVLLLFLGPRVILKRVLPAFAIGALLFVFRFTPDTYWDWISTIRNPTEEGSANSRLVVNAASIRMFFDHPLGVGYRNYPDVSPRYLPVELLSQDRRSAHNIYFTVLCETGIFGFIPWIGAIGCSLFLLRRLRKAAKTGELTFAPYALAMELGLYGWLVDGIFQGDQEADPAYWFMVLAVVATRLHHKQMLERAAGGAATPAPAQVSKPNPVWMGTRPRSFT